ncbi:MAG: T9SS type A sorting domain-containing protein [Bacteroidales bacterium]|nr:T9SS type A sorting domain-containing protein [Bacteroidales bacterium]
MKQKLILITCFLLAVCQIHAQSHRILRNTSDGITLKVQVGELQASEIQTADGVFSRITLDGAAQGTENIGKPELPIIIKTIEIPVCGELHVTATAGNIRTLTAEEAGIGHDIYPTQPLYHKSYTGDRPFVKDEATYRTNAAYGMPLAIVNKAGIARDVCMADIVISPIQVNPVTKAVTIYEDITITVTYDDVDMAATRELKLKYGSSEFGRPAQLVNTIESAQLRDALSTRPVKMLIIANDIFNGQLDAFADWKRRKGFLVEIAYTGTIGTTTTAIKNYITTLFNNATDDNPAPTYVLLVGDQAQIPTYSGQSMNSHITDLYYFTILGNDDVPDCYWGRFSAQNTSQLTPQIDKTLKYEQLTMGSDLSYLDRCLLVAGNDGGSSGDYGYSHANPAMHYFEDNYSATFFTTTDSYYNPHASSDDATIRTKLSNGTGYANYSAHCSSAGWADPAFTTSHISSLNNTGKYGFLVGNCCQSNKFEESECFGEAIMRATNKGAVGYIGGTDYTYWDHDYYWAVGVRNGNLSTSCTNCNLTTYDANNLGAYDKMCHTHGEAFTNWNVTQGSINYAGNMAVHAKYGASNSYVKYYWEIYELMGDPSVMPWLGQPADMTIRIDNNAPVNNTYEALDGTTTFTVSTGAPYSYVALTRNLTLITAVLTDGNGNCTLTFPAMSAGETYELAASAQNYKTTFTTINAMAGEGARVTITDVAVTNNTQATAGAHLTLDVTIENRYPDAATNTRITAATTSSQITLTDLQEQVGTVNSGDVRTLNAAFALNVSTAIADGDIAPIEFTVSYLSNGNAETTTYTYNLELVDALLAYVSDSYTIVNGNNDNIIDPGETVNLTIIDENAGHATAQNVVSELSTYYPLTPIINGSINIGTMNPQGQCSSSFIINIDNSVPVGTMIPFYHHIYSTSNPALSRLDTIWLVVGSIDATEDWESGTFTQFEWVNTSNYPWTIVNDPNEAHGGSYYAKSGNAGQSNSQSDLELSINSMDGEISFYAKVASEPSYDFFYFYIDGTEQLSYSGGVQGTGSSWNQTYTDTCTWQRYSFPITAGTHTIKFSFTKDQSVNGGSDCAKVDNITWPSNSGEIAPEPEVLNDISHSVLITTGNGDADINPGETIDLTITTENMGPDPLLNLTSVLNTTSPYATITNANETISYIAPNSTANTIYHITIAPNTPDSTLITFTHVVSDGTISSLTYTAAINVYEVATPRLVKISDSYAITVGNNDNTIDPGETVVLTIVDENTGRADAPDVISQLSTYYTPAAVVNGTINVGTIVAGDQYASAFTINIGSDVPVGTIIPYVHHIFSTTDPNADRTDTIYLTVGSSEATEDWETGDFTQFEWTNNSQYPWTIVNDPNEAIGGNYYAKSGNAGRRNTQSELELTIDCTDGEISFYSKVAARANYGFFRFYIDGVQQYEVSNGVQSSGGWGGTYTDTCTWQYHAFPITAGTHTIKFAYVRNNSGQNTAYGSDCAKLDNITWPTSNGEIAPMPEGIVITAAGLNSNSNGYEGETAEFDVTIENNSGAAINDVTLTLSTISSALTLTDATETVATIAGGQVLDLASIFAGQIGTIADGTLINCTVTADYLLSGVPTQQTYTFSFTAHAGWVNDLSHSVDITVGNGDAEINPGETIEVTITTENPGLTAVSNVTSMLTSSSQYITITNPNQTVNSIASNNTVQTIFTVSIDANTPDNTAITFIHTADADIHGSDTYSFTIQVLEEARVALEDVNHGETVINGNADAEINPGETVRISVYTRNNGRANAHNAISTLTSDSPYAIIASPSQTIGTINGAASINSQFDVDIDADTPDSTVITFTHTMTADEDTSSIIFSIMVIENAGMVSFVDLNYSVSILSGNNDATINPGERVKVTVYSVNEGTRAATNVISSLTSTSVYVTIDQPVITFPTVVSGATITSQFEMTVDPSTPIVTLIPLTHQITDGEVTASSEIELTVTSGTGINEQEGGNIRIYPNPASDNVNIVLEDNMTATAANIYDSYGKLVLSRSIEGDNTQINIGELAPGIYIIRIMNGNQTTAIGKIVKK